jgi:DNA (cytosine-5)-methyltransferase 1
MAATPRSSARKTIRVLDLFSGAGGLSAGLSTASGRYAIVRAVEADDAAAASYAANHGADKIYAGTIESWLKRESVPTADLVIGGPPCQGFSALGKQDVLDHRNQLWLRYAETIRKAEPRYFVLENVPAFLKSIQYKRLQQQCAPSRRLGAYTFQARILNAADYGAPQVRRRVILIGHHRDLEFPGFPVATNDLSDWVRLEAALAGLPDVVRESGLPDRWTEWKDRLLPGEFLTNELHLMRHYEDISLRRFAHIPAGGNRFDLPRALQSRCWRDHTRGSTDVMGRLSWDKPSVTIRTEFFKPEKGRYLHPTEPRALTHHEAARIQGFPDDYQWVGSKASIAKQIGNAVPLALGAAIGRRLLASF